MKKAEAYWISPAGEIFDLPPYTRHIEMIKKDSSRFGITDEFIAEHEKECGHYAFEGSEARNNIMLHLILNGWVRLRKNKDLWTVQISTEKKENLFDWMETAMNEQLPNWAKLRCEVASPYEMIHVLDTKGQLLVGPMQIRTLVK